MKYPIIFAIYIFLYVNQAILVKFSQNKNSTYTYDTVMVIMATDLLKLVVSIAIYLRTNKTKSLIDELLVNRPLFLSYLLPAFLYTIYNHLSFVNLTYFDPTTYHVLMQLRVVLTAIFFQIQFRRRLSLTKWFSLILLATGCIVKELSFASFFNFSFSNGFGPMSIDRKFGIFFGLLLVQIICSSFASVFTEYLLKKSDSKTDIIVQNIYMYTNAIFCDFLLAFYCDYAKTKALGIGYGNGGNKPIVEPLSPADYRNQSILVCLIVLNGTVAGITTSFFLKLLSSLLKMFANALEIFITSIICYFLFSIAITVETIVSFGIVSLALYIYEINN